MSLASRTQSLYDRLKAFPEGYDNGRPYLKADAFSAFLELRQTYEREILAALEELARLQRKESE